MKLSSGQDLEAERRRLGIDLDDLWVGYFALGGTAKPEEVHAYLRGEGIWDHVEHDVLAQAINENAIDRGQNHPAPYSEQVARGNGDVSALP